MDRISACKSILANAYDIPVTIFANKHVKVEQAALQELRTLLDLQSTLDELEHNVSDFFTEKASIKQIAITPDFHKGKGIPIGTTLKTKGFVVPQAIGKDVNCGMRLYRTDLKEAEIRSKLGMLKQDIRHVYFQGGRHIPLTPNQKQALLKRGLLGLLETHRETKEEGLWRYFRPQQQERDLAHVIDQGSLLTHGIFEGLDNYTKINYKSYDSQIGSIGGGNHFVEVQRVKSIRNGAIAHAWGIKEGDVTIMIHTGSVSVGYPTAAYFIDLMKEIYPTSLKRPQNGIFPLPCSERYRTQWDRFWMSLYNGANFAFGNRLFLGLMMQSIVEKHFGSTDYDLLYDSGHNMLWQEQEDGETVFVHRKGACPARGMEQLQGTIFQYTGEPVLIPGSMGASSFILAGQGNVESCQSASHGAGRALSRGDSLRVDETLLDEFMKKFEIITPINPDSQALKGRKDILKKWREEIKKEAPFAFKAIDPVINTQTEAGIANAVAELEPIFTIKG